MVIKEWVRASSGLRYRLPTIEVERKYGKIAAVAWSTKECVDYYTGLKYCRPALEEEKRRNIKILSSNIDSKLGHHINFPPFPIDELEKHTTEKTLDNEMLENKKIKVKKI